MKDNDYLLALQNAKEMAVEYGRATYVFDGEIISISVGLVPYSFMDWIAKCYPGGRVELRGKLAEIKKQHDGEPHARK